MKLVTLIIAILMVLTSAVFADSKKKKKTTPYGDSVTVYGVCKKPMKVNEALNALEKYFSQKGLKVEMKEHRGRFIKVNVYKDKKQVDRIILDRKTGRIRSIY